MNTLKFGKSESDGKTIYEHIVMCNAVYNTTRIWYLKTQEIVT